MTLNDPSTEPSKYDGIIDTFLKNVDAKDRWFRLKKYKKCFVGREAVDFLVHSGTVSSREEAVEVGTYLQSKRKLFAHVSGKHEFADDFLFYRYNSAAAEIYMPSNSALEAAVLSRLEDSSPPPGEEPETFRSFIERSVLLQTASMIQIAEETAEESPDDGSEESLQPLQQGMCNINDPFKAKIKPTDMRCIALVAHNHMKPAMKTFIEEHSEILKKFRLTGTNTTMTMCRTIFGADNPDVHYGPTFTSGPLGGDAQLAALMCYEDLGGIIFFVDPLSSHPHQADIDSLIRLANVGNVVLCLNPTTACGAMWMIRNALIANRTSMIPSFFETMESPCVPEYRAAQKAALESAVNS